MSEVIDEARERRISLTLGMLHALGDDELDKAQHCLETFAQENRVSMEQEDVVVFRVLIAIQRGWALNALHLLNEFDENFRPDLRVLCLFFLQDPQWKGMAEHLKAHSPDENIRRSMGHLLEAPEPTGLLPRAS
ncbi:MAG: HrpB1 family type III secretion system apparatus protein [Burkholderia gladioli]